MTERDNERSTQSSNLSILRFIKKVGKKAIKIPKSTYKKVKKGVKYIAKKTISVFKKSKKTRKPENSDGSPESNGSGNEMSLEKHGSSKKSLSRGPLKNTRRIHPSHAMQSKHVIVDIINDACCYINAIEKIVRNNLTHSIDSRTPLAILEYMRENNLEISTAVEAIEQKHIDRILKEKDSPSETVSRRMPTNIRTKNCILEELQPTIYLKYLFAHSPVLRKSYTGLYNTLQYALTVRAPRTTHVVNDVFLYLEVVKQVKLHIIEKVSKLKRASCNFVLYSCKTTSSYIE
ncbi:hypothetical protein NEPAR06_1403 [Nematocida parisii]|uniref:Uncharacterized protein n=1 Tax=Nematocida parisii (strain ERTm3) TaxID=935791 RepID=I3EKD5_NEMP3|nr:uncharacterized protein NEPG_00783 [Nematocida parisii ERTm1]EIJ89682.1 hypothetical protein NEQG_00452 [Nematocida parisii ERTm3]KAI5143382.1 hypothetical protein NEPAR07_0602 [Nematocida parisii]EIJ94116.1 hypothetical protein NEPG_00783 [Nematocida parisii ERTm1]KAI5154937.1 hypothetical protein NEPAR06_1403 [Nematocida parisii]KAI5156306.1 hypothetical protein NEPAR05_0467 [Nematocida parisii]|eukprot:XP_013058612.1 hypothetical protein NEPG_00783 [Nematocida parisii ERTm1]